MRIRKVEAGDLESLMALYRDLNVDDLAPTPERAREVWTQILAEESVRLLVGELDGALVASCVLVLVPNLTRGGRPYALIENVVTVAEHRKKGFATAILRHALEEAWARDCYKVMLLSGSRREETLAFYERAGFQRGVKTGFVAYPPIPKGAL